MKMTLRTLTAITLAALALPCSAAEPIRVKLWPQGAPEKEGFTMAAESAVPKKTPDDVMRLTNVTDPILTVFQPEKPNGTAVIVCPGGGYNILAYEHEGSQTCEWLNSLGITGVLLKYRVPRRDPENPSVQPLQDAQRALSLVRKHASEWKIDPKKVGILGFSAGGNLCILAALHANDRTYPQDPAIDEADATPNFALAIYPAYLTVKGNDFELDPAFKVTKSAPPMFLAHAHDDKITASGSALLYLEYKKLNLPAELHIYTKGGHGYGMKKAGNPVNDWPDRAADWLRSMGWASPKGS